jgi:hypothetical protein
LFWWLKRSAVKQADPVEQNRKRYAQIDKEITSGDSGALTIAAELISMNLTVCRGPVVVVSADQREIVVSSNEVFRAEMDGVFMGMEDIRDTAGRWLIGCRRSRQD